MIHKAKPSPSPSTAAPFFGRETLLATVRGAVGRGRSVVTLTGPAGVGKSSLARACGAGDSSSRSLVVRVALGSARESGDVARAVGRALGVAAAAAQETNDGGDAALGGLARKVAASGVSLLVLDDADSVLAPVGTLVLRATEAGAHCTFLVTSREPLGIAGERVVTVPPLEPAAGEAMFEALAEGGTWTRAELSALIAQLDGIPLAIELAAKRARLLPPRELVAHLDERLAQLRSDRRDVDVRHATLWATFDSSWTRLDDDERAALAAIAAFEGSLPIEAFEAVVGPGLAGDPIDVAESLMRKSLVAWESGQGAGRLGMLRALRAFVRQQGAAEGRSAVENMVARHRAFFLERAERHAARAYGPGADSALDAIEADLPNLRIAFTRCMTSEPAVAARIAIAMADLAVVRPGAGLGAPLFLEAGEAADASGDARLRVATRIALGRLLLELGQPRDAAATLDEAVAIADAAGEVDVAADARRSLGWAELALGRAESAVALFNRAIERHAKRPDVRGHADALAARGLARCLLGARADGVRDIEGAHALHLVRDDGIRRESVREMAALVGIEIEPARGRPHDPGAEAARLQASAAANHAAGRLWREAIDLFRLAALDTDDEARRRHRDRASAAAMAGGIGPAVTEALAAASSSAGPAACPRDVWLAGPEARWIVPPGAKRVDLSRHGSLRRVLNVLIETRLSAPGTATSAIDLLERGWPGERVFHDSGMLRVYTAIRRLRAMGFAEALETRDDGYLLSEQVAFERREA